MFMIYGMDFAVDENIYLELKKKIKDKLSDLSEMSENETNELGRLNQIDRLKYTSIRIRGMWLIKNPWKAFDYVTSFDASKKFEFCAILNDEKIKQFKNYNDLEKIKREKYVVVKDVQIKNPNKPEELRNAKLIRFSVDS